MSEEKDKQLVLSYYVAIPSFLVIALIFLMVHLFLPPCAHRLNPDQYRVQNGSFSFGANETCNTGLRGDWSEPIYLLKGVCYGEKPDCIKQKMLEMFVVSLVFSALATVHLLWLLDKKCNKEMLERQEREDREERIARSVKPPSSVSTSPVVVAPVISSAPPSSPHSAVETMHVREPIAIQDVVHVANSSGLAVDITIKITIAKSEEA